MLIPARLGARCPTHWSASTRGPGSPEPSFGSGPLLKTVYRPILAATAASLKLLFSLLPTDTTLLFNIHLNISNILDMQILAMF